MALRSLDAARELHRAVVVDKGFSAICQERCCLSVQLICREERRRRVCRGGLAGPRTLAGDTGQYVHRPGCHRSHGDSRNDGCQHRAVRRIVRPESCGAPGKVPAGSAPGPHSAVSAVQFGPVLVAAPPVLHGGGRFERGFLQQCTLAPSLQECNLGRLLEPLRAQVLRMRVIQVLSAVLGGSLREEEELVQVPVALCSGWVAEGQQLFHHAH